MNNITNYHQGNLAYTLGITATEDAENVFKLMDEVEWVFYIIEIHPQ